MDPAAELRVIVEPTGPATAYVQDFWHQHAVRVDCVIPLRVKRFRQSYQSHTKTDRLDAFILAKYAHTYRNLLYPAIIPADDRLGILRDSIKEVWHFSRDLGSEEKRATALVDQWIPEWGTIAPSLHQANGSATYREVWQVFAETPHWTVTTERIQRHLLAVRHCSPSRSYLIFPQSLPPGQGLRAYSALGAGILSSDREIPSSREVHNREKRRTLAEWQHLNDSGGPYPNLRVVQFWKN